MTELQETIPRPEIARYCARCRRCWDYTDERAYQVVSPTGVCHVGADYGMTLCGIDATGPKWWWPL
jgi:hypothetical protein